jgi:crooked neck
MNYDAWFDLVNLEIASGNIVRTRDTFENAVKNVPLSPEKRLWRRYIYLWYNYATFEEMEASDPIKAKEVYERALKLVPHK